MPIRLTLLIAFMLLLGGCPERQPVTTTKGEGEFQYAAPKASKYPIDFPDRPYTAVHASVAKAWQLVEVSYFVVNDKYINAGKDQRQNISKEIEEKIFGVNEEVEALFRDGIKAEPRNPLNHAAYAIYLKPRKRIVAGGYQPSWDESIAQIDKAIALWPDEPSFYTTKIYIITAPHQAHEWLRAGAMEDMAIAEMMGEVDKLFTQAEKYDPQNNFINYWHAQLLFRYTPGEALDSIKGQLLREIHAGNQKQEGYFLYGAPLPPRILEPQMPVLSAADTEPVYVDQLVQFGSYSRSTMNSMVTALLAKLTWPRDKREISDLMYMYYNLGRTKPYDTSYFSMQQMIMDKIRHDVTAKSDDGQNLAAAGRYLEDQYITIGNRLFELNRIRDPAQVNQVGINAAEEGGSRQMDLRDPLQQSQAAFLLRFGELVGIEFPLPADKAQW